MSTLFERVSRGVSTSGLDVMTTLSRGRSRTRNPHCHYQVQSSSDSLSMVRLGLCDLIGSNASGGNRWACIRVHLDWLQTELKALHREFHIRLQDHTAWVGLVMAAVLIAELPELNWPRWTAWSP